MAVDFGHQIIHLAPLQLQMLVFSHSVKCLNLQMVLIGWGYKKIGRERRVGAIKKLEGRGGWGQTLFCQKCNFCFPLQKLHVIFLSNLTKDIWRHDAPLRKPSIDMTCL